MDRDSAQARRGRVIAMVIAGTAIVWVLAQAIGRSQGWNVRTFAFFDLAALGGFAMALIMAFGLWRARRNNKD